MVPAESSAPAPYTSYLPKENGVTLMPWQLGAARAGSAAHNAVAIASVRSLLRIAPLVSRTSGAPAKEAFRPHRLQKFSVIVMRSSAGHAGSAATRKPPAASG